MSSSEGALAPTTPVAFIRKWKNAALNERQTAHEHFLDLCSLFGHPTPTEDDPTGELFAFEKGATKVGGGRGFADVWKKGFFAWEYKRKDADLDAALLQLVRYAPALENPPLHVVCDIKRFRIHTAWTNTVPASYEVALDDLVEPAAREVIRNVFYDPDKLKPTKTRAAITAEAADKFSTIASRLQGRGTPSDIAHFVNQLVFCFFAQSVKLLPDGLLGKILRRSAEDPQRAKGYLDKLFTAMESGGEFDLNDIAWFNGGLFDGRKALPVDDGDIGLLLAAGTLDWSMIDPTIFGTLFERFLDPGKRTQIGAHYTDREKIERIIEPVILRPLRAEWDTAKQEIADLLNGQRKPPMRKKLRRRMTTIEAADAVRARFVERLRNLRILDPACGSGNFLYLALQGVKDIENRANLDCEVLGLRQRALPLVGPEILRGIEINPLAAELARTTIWIGDIQWRLRNGIHAKPVPILRKLDAIEQRDALISHAPNLLERDAFVEAEWPAAEFIVGNPPFLGDRKMIAALGEPYVDALRAIFADRIPGRSDLVSYWLVKAADLVSRGVTKRAGLVATNSIRGGNNLPTMHYVSSRTRIFEAWRDEPWVVEGAAVRVALVCFASIDSNDPARLDGRSCDQIGPDLFGSTWSRQPSRLADNVSLSFIGTQKNGRFEVPGSVARSWLTEPINPNDRSNSDVLAPWANGAAVVRGNPDTWIIDFGVNMPEREAALYEKPFEHVRANVRRSRLELRRTWHRTHWWLHGDPRPAMRRALSGLKRYLLTPRISKHRLFVWMHPHVLPDSAVTVIAREDDLTFGVLHSRFHEAWSLRLGTTLEDRPRYTPTTTFETFPFPAGLTPDVPVARHAADPKGRAIADAARHLDRLRNAWLTPPDLVRVEAEVVAGYPDRTLAKNAAAQKLLAKRTLTNLYNQRPQWLLDAHRELDEAVAAAYGWSVDISDEEAVANLLTLNLERPAAERLGKRMPRGPSTRDEPQFKLPVAGGNKGSTARASLGDQPEAPSSPMHRRRQRVGG